MTLVRHHSHILVGLGVMRETFHRTDPFDVHSGRATEPSPGNRLLNDRTTQLSLVVLSAGRSIPFASMSGPQQARHGRGVRCGVQIPGRHREGRWRTGPHTQPYASEPDRTPANLITGQCATEAATRSILPVTVARFQTNRVTRRGDCPGAAGPNSSS